MGCIKPFAPSRNETNSSRVSGGAVGAILVICSYGGRDQIRRHNQTGPAHRPEGLAFRQISRPRLTFREQLVGRFVQTLLLTARIRQMTNQVAIQLVNVRTLKIVKLLTFTAEDRVIHDHADMDAFAVEYIAVHDRPPIERPPRQRLRLLSSDSETNRALRLFPLRLWPSVRPLYYLGRPVDVATGSVTTHRRSSKHCPPRRWPRLGATANPHGGTARSVHWQPVRTANIRVSEADKLPRG